MKKRSIIAAFLVMSALVSCSPKEKPEEFYSDDFTPGQYPDEMDLGTAILAAKSNIKDAPDYSQLESAYIHVSYGADLTDYVTDSGKVSGNYQYDNYGVFSKKKERLSISFNYSVDETLTVDGGGTKTVKGNTVNEVAFWMDGDKGFEAYHKYSSSTPNEESKVYYVNEGEDGQDLKDAIDFGTISEMITPQIDTWEDALPILESGDVENAVFRVSGYAGDLYGSWDYNGYHMELQSHYGYMVYEKIEKTTATSHQYYNYRYIYDENFKIDVPELDSSWTLSE